MKRTFFVAMFLIICLSGNTKQLFFSGYSISDGLSQSVVNCIFQDSKGFIWLGTQNGLNKFDGYTFKIYSYDPDDTTSISNNWIFGITEDKAGNIWVGTKGGLNRFIRKEERFEKIRYSAPYPGNLTEYVYDVKCSRNGNILINTPPVLTVCNPEHISFSHYISTLPYDGSVKDYNIPLTETENGNIWIGSTNGLAVFRPSVNNPGYSAVSGYPAGLSDKNITALDSDNSGNIWIGTDEGLFRFYASGDKGGDNSITERVSFPGNNFIRAITHDNSGNLWIASEGGGLTCICNSGDGHKVTENFNAGNSEIFNNIILSLAIDRSQNLWLGTLSGVNKTDLKKQKFRLYRKGNSPYSVNLADNVIASLYKNRDNEIWIGNWGMGLNIYNRESGEVEYYSPNLKGRHYIPNGFVHVIFKDSDSNIWTGTRDGLLVFSEESRTFLRPDQFPGNPGLPEFPGLRIFSMIQSKNGDYWIATQDGLFRKRPGIDEPERFHTEASQGQKISSNLVYSVMEDSEGLIWIASGEGLYLFDPAASEIKNFRKSEKTRNSLADNYIISLCEDKNGDIWIGTTSYINKFSKEDSTFHYYSKEDGLPGNIIYSIVKDKTGKLWFATGSGLCRYDPDTDSFHTYSVEDGIQGLEFNIGAAYASDDGEIFFGGMNGFNSFYPDSITVNSNIPGIEFTAAYIINKGIRKDVNIDKTDRIELDYKDHSFTVEFAVMEFTNPSRNMFIYKMEGIDDEWIDIGNRNFVLFANLPPGDYNLQVKGSNNDGVWNEKGAEVAIHVNPPWWRSRAAYTGYIILLIAIIYLIVKIRERRHVRYRKILEQKVKERTIRIEEQKAEILKKNAELNELNATKDKFFSIIAHDLRNPFNSIIGLTDVLLMNLQDVSREKLQKYLINIKHSSHQAHELLENLLVWARSQTGALNFNPAQINIKELADDSLAIVSAHAAYKNISINLDIGDDAEIFGDPDMIKTILRNLLTNAIKFTRENGEVKVHLSTTGKECILAVKDNGIGISEEKITTLFSENKPHTTKGTSRESGSGLGLVLCRYLAEKHGGRIEVLSEKEKGSEFRVILPSVKNEIKNAGD
jgi:signal transduction histidine kinase/ligand-binding sensor domain-containing protein